MVQNYTISDKIQESEYKIYLPVKRTCKETIVKEIFKLISELPSQTLTNGKSQDELGDLK